MDDEGICELVSNCSDLVMIDLTCCNLLTDRALSAIANHSKKLECLRLESCSLITEKGLDTIGTFCTDLKEMDLTDCNINDAGKSKRVCLNICRCFAFNAQVYVHFLAALKCLSGCSKLEILKLGLCSNITSEGLAHIGLNCRNLCELDLYR